MPFDLALALAGHPVRTRAGRRVEGLRRRGQNLLSPCAISYIVDGVEHTADGQGRVSETGQPSDADLLLAHRDYDEPRALTAAVGMGLLRVGREGEEPYRLTLREKASNVAAFVLGLICLFSFLPTPLRAPLRAYLGSLLPL